MRCIADNDDDDNDNDDQLNEGVDDDDEARVTTGDPVPSLAAHRVE